MIAETAIAAAAVSWLQRNGFETFLEVGLSWQEKGRSSGAVVGDHRADIVARRGGRVVVVECKLALSWDLLAQAKRWKPFAHGVYVAAHAGRRTDGRHEALLIARVHYGFGVLELTEHGIVERFGPILRELGDDALERSLLEGHKTAAAAGSNTGGQWTTFKETNAKLAAYVAANPGCKLEAALAVIDHHYGNRKSAVASLQKHITKGRVPGVYSGWKRGLFSTPEEARTSIGGLGSTP